MVFQGGGQYRGGSLKTTCLCCRDQFPGTEGNCWVLWKIPTKVDAGKIGDVGKKPVDFLSTEANKYFISISQFKITN